RGALRVVVLARDVEDVGTDDLGDVGEDLRQPVGVVFLVDVFDVALALVLGDGVAHVVDVEAQGLGEVVESLQLQARQRLDHVIRSRFGRKVRDYAANDLTPRATRRDGGWRWPAEPSGASFARQHATAYSWPIPRSNRP